MNFYNQRILVLVIIPTPLQNKTQLWTYAIIHFTWWKRDLISFSITLTTYRKSFLRAPSLATQLQGVVHKARKQLRTGFCYCSQLRERKLTWRVISVQDTGESGRHHSRGLQRGFLPRLPGSPYMELPTSAHHSRPGGG